MKPLARLAVLLVLVAAVASPLAAAQKGRGKAAAEPEKPLLEQMAAELKLTDAQQADLKEKIKARDDALAAWTTANADKLKAAEDAAKTARAGTDVAAKKKAGADLKVLTDARKEAAAKAEEAILAVLTPEQKNQWQGLVLFQTTLGRLKKCSPTEEQQAKIRQACAATARDLAAVEGDDRKAKQAKAEIPKRLQWAIEEVILTPEQKAMVARKPAAAAAPATTSAAPAAAPAAPK